MGLGEAVFDTNILIDFLNQVPAAAAELLRYEKRYISQVTWIEVMVGVKPADESGTRRFLDTFHLLRITDEVAERAVAIRQQRRLKLPDAIILATAMAEGLLLVTRNPKDFADEAMIRIPYKL
jgi:predicted nucleic acid-binding protein